MQKHERQIVQIIRDEAARRGWEVKAFHDSKTHFCVTVTGPDWSHKLKFGSSPGSRDDQVKYARQWVRKLDRDARTTVSR